MSRSSKMALAWIARAGGTVEAAGGAGTLEGWQTPPNAPYYRRLSKQVIFNLEAKGLLRFTDFRVGRDGKTRPVKAMLVQPVTK
jgi:hypothetical protein